MRGREESRGDRANVKDYAGGKKGGKALRSAEEIERGRTSNNEMRPSIRTSRAEGGSGARIRGGGEGKRRGEPHGSKKGRVRTLGERETALERERERASGEIDIP